MNKGPKFSVKKTGRPYRTFHPGRPRKMAANEISSEAVVVFPYKDDREEGKTEIVGAVSREDYEGDKNSISDMDEAALNLGEGDKKVSRDNTEEELVEEFICEY